MTTLRTTPALRRPDEVYQHLVDAYAGLTDHDVARFHARLVLLLINQVGDERPVLDAIAAARAGLDAETR